MSPAIVGDWNSVVEVFSNYVFCCSCIFSMILYEVKGCTETLENNFYFKQTYLKSIHEIELLVHFFVCFIR